MLQETNSQSEYPLHWYSIKDEMANILILEIDWHSKDREFLSPTLNYVWFDFQMNLPTNHHPLKKLEQPARQQQSHASPSINGHNLKSLPP